MKHFKLLLLMASALLMFSCEKPINNDPPLPEAEVTLRTIAGAWQLTEWNGKALHEGTYLYIELDKNQRFEMWDNLGSMYTEHKTGSFAISKDDDDRTIITGQYDNGVGDWNNSYVAYFMANGDYMAWTTDTENMLFKRIDAIPELY